VLYSTIPPQGSKSGNARDGDSWKGMSTKNVYFFELKAYIIIRSNIPNAYPD